MRGEPKKRCNFFLDEKLIAELQHFANKNHEGNMSQCLRKALERYFLAARQKEAQKG